VALQGVLVPHPLQPPVAEELPRLGAGGVDCRRCEEGDAGALWSDEHWIVRTLDQPSGLPMAAFLETRAHHDFRDLPDELAAELGPMLIRVQSAVFAIGDIGNVHVCRWGTGVSTSTSGSWHGPPASRS